MFRRTLQAVVLLLPLERERISEISCLCVTYLKRYCDLIELYRGADKSLAQPDWKNNWKVAIFFRREGHSCRGDLVGRTAFWIFFSSGLQKLEFVRCSLFPLLVGLRTLQHFGYSHCRRITDRQWRIRHLLWSKIGWKFICNHYSQFPCNKTFRQKAFFSLCVVRTVPYWCSEEHIKDARGCAQQAPRYSTRNA